MSYKNYNNYNVDLILSTKKNSNKRNLIKINGKYYFQIPNIYEDNLENNDETNYCEDIQIEENGSYAKIVSLNDLYNICKYFQLKDEIAAILIFQFLKFQKIDEGFIRFFYQYGKKDVLKFIQKHNYMVLSNSLRTLNKQDDSIKAYSQYLANYYIFHSSLTNVCYSPVNVTKMEELILQQKSEEITEEEVEKFEQWTELLDFNIISENTIFNECFNLEKEDVWTVQRVQQYLDDSINNLQIDQTYINSLESLKLFFSKNQKTPQLTKEKFNQKCTVEMRLKKNKHRLAVKSQSCEFLETIFYKNEIQMKFNSTILNKVKQELKKPLLRSFYIYLDLKDFCLNVDYDLVEKVINLPELANYLRQRKIYYVDPVTKKEEELTLRKGILIGE